MVQLLSIFAVVASALTFGAVAFPTAPGTCLVTGMSGPHGSTATATGGNFTISIKAPSAGTSATTGTYAVTISGTGNFTGLLLYAVDTTQNNTRFGSFINPPSGFAVHTGCGGTNPASNTLGHSNANVKKLPMSFTWSPAGYGSSKTFTAGFTGIVMTSNIMTWHVLPMKSITIAAAGNTTNATTSAAITSAASTSAMPSSSSNATTTMDMGNGTTTTSSAATHVSSFLALVAAISFAALLM